VRRVSSPLGCEATICQSVEGRLQHGEHRRRSSSRQGSESAAVGGGGWTLPSADLRGAVRSEGGPKDGGDGAHLSRSGGDRRAPCEQ
jgi:hypothetical protein